MIDTHNEENHKSDVEAVFRHSQCKFQVFILLANHRSHILVSLQIFFSERTSVIEIIIEGLY